MKTSCAAQIQYEDLTDEALLLRFNEGDEYAYEYLMEKYKNFVRLKTRSYFIYGADREDIIQEGMIGLFKAMRDYCPDKQVAFKSFAEICITRQIITAIKSATRQKHIPLNSYVSLNKPVYDEESERTLIDIIAAVDITDPETLFIGQEDYNAMEANVLGLLSELEKEALTAYLSGKTYHEMSRELNRHVKSIDNALQRVKRKLEKFMEEKACEETGSS